MKTLTEQEYAEFQNLRAHVNIGLSRESDLKKHVKELCKENERLRSDLKSFIQAGTDVQKQFSEQAEEINRLRYQNEGLKLENSELESDLSKAKELLSRARNRHVDLNSELFKEVTLFLKSESTVKPEQTEEPKVTCYEIWRPDIPDNGCKTQCKECAEKEKLKVGEVEQTTESQEELWKSILRT